MMEQPREQVPHGWCRDDAGTLRRETVPSMLRRLALAAGLPLVTLHNRGFARLEKPPGRYFEACAAGRLLMLAPAAWPYQPGAKVMTRADATALNRLCQWLVGADAAEINYHGMSPGNVDALARAAACGEAS